MFELTFRKFTAAFDFSFFAAVALTAVLGGKYAAAGLAVCIWHELGHLAVMKITGIPVKRVVFYGAGIKIVTDGQLEYMAFGVSFAVLIAGSAANLAAAAILYRFGNPDIRIFAALNLAIGAFNLLPLQNLDGGKIIIMLIRSLCVYSRACLLERYFKWVNVMLIMTALIVFAFLGKGNMTLYVTLCYLLVSSMTC